MNYRCLNNLFYYCSGEPVKGETKEEKFYVYEAGKRVEFTRFVDYCKLDPRFCGFAQTFAESLEQTLSVKR